MNTEFLAMFHAILNRVRLDDRTLPTQKHVKKFVQPGTVIPNHE